MVIDPATWNGVRVFVTGHTGFKGGWLVQWLTSMGAEVCGYSLAPPSQPSFFEATGLGAHIDDIRADIRDAQRLKDAVVSFAPKVVFHLAAQPIVRYGYDHPHETFDTNVMGTLNVLEAVRAAKDVEAVINVTSDKTYLNREWMWPYREDDPLGGRDPYSASKSCADILCNSYTLSYFSDPGSAKIATGRAGNVIGGGDWGQDRLVPDLMGAFANNKPAVIRNPDAIRPWQHVLDAVSGYILLAQRLRERDGSNYVGAWNFGPDYLSEKPVSRIAELAVEFWGEDARITLPELQSGPHEATFLKVDSSKSRSILDWQPRWSLEEAMQQTSRWYQAHHAGDDMFAFSKDQINVHQSPAVGARTASATAKTT